MAVSSARESLVLGRYRVEATIGAGAFGRVLKVIDAESGQPRALKIATGATEAMLLDELEHLSRLRHPALPRVFEVGRTAQPIDDLAAGAPFFVAEWIAGGRCDTLAWTDPRALWSLIADIAGALAVIHAHGLVHGDVAPQNILVAGDRAVLVDLGLARAATGAATGSARGTPAYMAPEAFAGFADARSDLYSLGAVAARLVLGRAPFVTTERDTIGELAYRALTTPQPPLPGIPAPLADLVTRLYARDADARPPSALAVLDELDALAPVIAPNAARRARPKVGSPPAETSWQGATQAIAELVRGLSASARVQLVVGAAGSGARELVDHAVRRWQLDEVVRRREAAPILAGTLDELAARVDQPATTEPVARWIDRVARTLRKTASLVIVELGDDPRAADTVAALARAGGTRPAIAIVEGGVAARDGVELHVAPQLDAEGVRDLAATMLGNEPPAAWAWELFELSDGQPRTVVELLRSIADEPEPFAVDWAARSTAGVTELRGRQLRAVSAGARRLALAIAVWGGRARIDRALATARTGDTALGYAEVLELERAGLVRRRGDELAIDRATADAAEANGTDQLVALATAGLALALASDARGSAGEVRGSDSRGNAGDVRASDSRGSAGEVRGSDSRRASDSRGTSDSRAVIDARGVASHAPSLEALAALLERVPLDAARAVTACEVAEQLVARGRADRGRVLAEQARTVVPGRAGLIAARAAAATGAYPDALVLARGAAAAGADAIEAQLVIARTSQRAGDLDAAEVALSALHAAHPEHDDAAGAYARLLVTRSRYRDARRVAETGGALTGLRAEAAGLAAFYLGELDAADQAFAALEVSSAAAGDAAAVGRALSLRGMVAQQRGQLGLASDRYREAARKLAEVGEIHAAAVAELNLGTALAERGRASEALPRLAAASRVFADLHATTEQVAADLNRGNALVMVGQAAEARTAAETALARAEGAPHLRAFALLVLGDARVRLGDAAGAERAYREALAIGTERGDAHAQVSAYVLLAEAGHACDADVEALCASDDDRDRWTIARGRLALATGIDANRSDTNRPDTNRPDDVDWLALAQACANVGARATDADRLDRAFRAHAVAALLAQRGREAVMVRRETERARAAHASIVAATAPAFRAALDRDPDLLRLPATDAAAPPQPTRVADAGAGAAHLRRLLTLSRRLNSEADVARILDEVIDTAIELTAAERGFLLLREGNELVPVVSRNFAMGDLERDDRSVSRSIAERAAQTGEPVITVDAGIDERFAIAASVAALRLRSVLAVPLRQRGVITGCIYVDHRLRGGAFDDTAATVLGELADIAAIAIENARLTDHLRRTTHEVDELNRRLAEDLDARESELVRVKADLPDRDRLRNRYERIVGRSPAMVRMLDIIDRATVTALPVVIVGESGTGKELVARALHDHGPRRDGAFVAINCSAVPEQLLESELFGHVRGAFTGADRDRRGLFEVADGGTLFLDEIADTSVAMQAKLLRVLQDGMIRRVGDTKTHKVDVRVIAASQRGLAELVTAGTFREDLRFRLEVISIPVPPLRERDGDIPLLVERLLAQLCPQKPPPKLTRAASRALAQHRWPGNVRELENALARGVAMGGDVLDVPDLPEAVAAAAARPEPAKPAIGDDLRLKPALLATEQAYLSAAMNRAKNNQTVAARLLGLSRFGLQKKLRRIAGDDAGDEDE